MSGKAFWTVKGEGMGGSTVEHEDLEAAAVEAMRLAEKNPGHNYYVMGILYGYRAEKPVVTRIV